MKNPSERRPKEGNDTTLRKLGLFAVIVGDLIGYTGAGVALGYLAWARWGAPWWVLVLSSLIGLIWAFYKVYRLAENEL